MIFFTPDEQKFYLVVNGIQQNSQPLSNIKITEMSAPIVYDIKIKFASAALEIITDKVSLEPGTEKSWRIITKTKKGSNKPFYVIKNAAEIPLDNNTASTNTFPQEQIIVYHNQPLPATQVDGVSFSMQANEQGGSVSFNMGSGGNNNNSNAAVVQTTTQVAGNGYCNSPLDAISFMQQLERVRTQTTGAGRKIIAEKIAQQYCLTAQQVFELCDALYLAADKLALAKYCYNRCFNPQQYEEVYKALPTSSLVKELDDYINSFGHTVQQPAPPSTQPVRVEYVQGYNGPYGCPQPMSNAMFASAKNTIEDADFENTRITTAKNIIGANCLTTEQVMAICKLFDFEHSKIELAKFAYSHTYDKANYFKVNTVFEFDSSKQELNKYVQGK